MDKRFWTFIQNNSGGHFDYQPNDGITHYVVVEATSLIHALSRAADIGLYFNGCDSGMDCPCCGDRWSEPWLEAGDAVPSIYATPAHEWSRDERWSGMYDVFAKGEICIHRLDGSKEWLASPTGGAK